MKLFVKIFFLSLAFFLVACGSAQPTGISSGDTGFVAGDGSSVLLPKAERRPAPEINEPTFNKNQFVLSEQAGNVVVLNVWGSWCAPCRAEAKELADLDRSFVNQNVVFLGINTRDSFSSAQNFIERFTIEYENIEDQSGKILLKFKDTLSPNAIPTTLVLDKEGRVAARILGPVDISLLRGFITNLLEES
jgi:thiol-disulfide isomerase/thioredoxin